MTTDRYPASLSSKEFGRSLDRSEGDRTRNRQKGDRKMHQGCKLGSAVHWVISSFIVLSRSFRELVAGHETEKVEFKTSLRWDYAMNSVNRSLEVVGAKAIAGFLNAEGGSLVLGVDDQGEAVGLEQDFRTLRRSDRDGYQQFLMGVVKKRLGGDLCPLVHLAFTSVEQHDVCRVVVEPSHRPVYLEEEGAARLYLRMGNSTRRLDVREAIEYVQRRWPGRVKAGAPVPSLLED